MSEMCVLLVDDDRAIRALLSATFKRFGISTEEAEDGEVAIERLQTRAYEVVLLDLMMPKVNGMQVLAFMKENLLNTPVIVLSAASQQFLDSVDGTMLVEVIRKPFNVHEITAKVLLLCGHPDAIIERPSA